jgi:hypothetical protein
LENPGPGHYYVRTSLSPNRDETSRNLTPARRHSISRISLGFETKDPASFPGISMTREKRDAEKLSQIVYQKNLEHKIIGKDSPGPGVYN